MGIIESISSKDHSNGTGNVKHAENVNSNNFKRNNLASKENRTVNSEVKSSRNYKVEYVKHPGGQAVGEESSEKNQTEIARRIHSGQGKFHNNNNSKETEQLVRRSMQEFRSTDFDFDAGQQYFYSLKDEMVNPLYEYRQLLWPTVKERDLITFYDDDCSQPMWADHNHDCNYTCHQQCSGMVTLNCKTQAAEAIEETENYEMKFEETDLKYSDETLRGDNLKHQIDRFNSKSEDCQIEMVEQDDGETFHGFIRVHMNLSRPINVLAGTRPPSIYDIIYDEEEYTEKTLTSFYLPRDTVKAIHITSKTTAQELITALLKKFKVVDNPRKFRLYDKSYQGDGTMKGVLRRIQDQEKPLWLVMAWDNDLNQNHKIVLQENEIGDILWDAFTFPELNNFLRILDREEEEYLNQVYKKYKGLQNKLQEAIVKASPSVVPEETAEPFTDM